MRRPPREGPSTDDASAQRLDASDRPQEVDFPEPFRPMPTDSPRPDVEADPLQTGPRRLGARRCEGTPAETIRCLCRRGTS